MVALIITSGAYIDQEMTAELGKIPPSFLPVGGKRLFQLQCKEAAAIADKVILTLPDGFIPSKSDLKLLRELDVRYIYTEEGIRLCESLTTVINKIDPKFDRIRILHGDTLIYELSNHKEEWDSFSLHKSTDLYNWAKHSDRNEHGNLIQNDWIPDSVRGEKVLSGYFSFSSRDRLLESLILSKGNFVVALNEYSKSVSLKPSHQKGKWLDFGHSTTFYRSRQSLTTERDFNSLQINENTVIKSSVIDKKIKAEAEWFENIPPSLRLHLPAYLGRQQGSKSESYKLSYEAHLPLNDIYVFGRLPKMIWQNIFSACSEFLNKCASYVPPNNIDVTIQHLYAGKSRARIEQFCREQKIDQNKEWVINGWPTVSLSKAVDELSEVVERSGEYVPGIMHGDFCFSNILYDSRRRIIKAVDPRGHIHGYAPTIYGDLRYDIAKLAHSVIGKYDFIISNYFSMAFDGRFSICLDMPESSDIRMVEDIFTDNVFAGISPKEHSIKAVCALLFLSMLPLHNDNIRAQQAFLATGLKLWRSAIG